MIVEFTFLEWKLFLREYESPHKIRIVFPYIYLNYVANGDLYSVDMTESIAEAFELEKLKLMLKYG